MRKVAVSNKDGVTPNGGAPVAVAGVPFTAAAHRHQEPAFKSPAKLLGAATQQLDPINVPSFGYLRHLFLDVVSSGGTIGPGVFHEDAPYNIIQSLTLLDVNGAPIVGPIDGFGLYLANLIGGYVYNNNPGSWPLFTAGGSNPRFQLRVPVELAAHNALGSIANQNAAAPYQLIIVLNNTTTVWTTPPTTPPSVTVQGTLETWTLPAQVDSAGNPQNQLPPAHGTGQFWSSRNQTGLAAGDNTVPIVRVGSLLRNIIFVCRNATPVRADNVFPDPAIINWDGRQLVNEPQAYRISKNFDSVGVRPTGVFAHTFDETVLGKVGDESPNLWLPTQQSTRLELNGTLAAAGSIQVLVNDVQPIEVAPDQRYVEDNATAPALQGSGAVQGAGVKAVA